MSWEENKAIVRKAIEATNRQDLFSVDELYAPDSVDHSLKTRGLKSIKQFITMLIKRFPDFHMTVEDIIAEGDTVWVRTTDTGTHTGEYYGFALRVRKFHTNY